MPKDILFSILILLNTSTLISQPGPGGNSWGGNVGGNTLSGGGTNKMLNVKVLLEGAFNGGEMNTSLYNNNLLPNSQPYNTLPWNYPGSETVSNFPPNTVDWVLVELRDAPSASLATPATTLSGWPKAFLLSKEGYLMGPDGYKPLIGNPNVTHHLFILIRHRNHIDILSANPLIYANDTYSYDFTTSLSQAFEGGDGYKQIQTGVFGMISGDAGKDGIINISDFNDWSTQFGILGSYDQADFDLDGNINISDFNLWSVNFGFNHPVNAPINTSQEPQVK